MKRFFSRLSGIAVAQAAGLTLLLAVSFYLAVVNGRESALSLAVATAREGALGDLEYRELLLDSGSAYLQMSPRVIPDPALAGRPERDLILSDGRRFTLVVPSYLLRLVHHAAPTVPGHASIKTLQPMGPDETPDRWEAGALARLRQGATEVHAVVTLDGKEYLRYMRRLLATAACAKTRPGQGIKEGDLFGGLSMTLPMAEFAAMRTEQYRIVLSMHTGLWLLGLLGIGWSYRDIKRRDEETRAAKEELEKTFDAFGEIITVQDQEMRITRINRAGCAMFGASEKELVGKHCYELFRGATVPCADCPELDALRDGKLHQTEIAHENLHKVFSVAAAPLTDQAGKVVRIVHLARDITEKKRMERQLRQAQKMEAIGTLAGGIAHDFNNILAAVIGFSELAMLDLPVESPAHADLDQVLRASLRAKELVRQILTFSRQTEQHVQPLRLQPIVKESLKLLRASIPTTIELRQQIADECGMVVADPTQLHQVIMNLCTNGYQAMREKGGMLGVTLEPVELGPADVANKIALKPGHYVRLSISDTGSGIAPEVLERIFEPYFTTKAKGEGTGLGLSMVHGIVQGLGGHVSVYSEPGRGTTFHVYLPMLSSLAEVWPVAGAATEVQIPTGNERVLVLDDEEGVVTMEQRILTSLGYTVCAFTDCTEAMDEFMRYPDAYDLVITDMNMPHVSGAEVVAAVRAVRPEIPIIMCTGFSEIMNEEKAWQLGINRLAMKPLTVKELAQAVREVLDARR